MMDSYYAPTLEKELVFEDSGDLIFSTPKRKPAATPVLDPDIARLPKMAALSPAADTEMSRKMQITGQVGLGWLR